MAKRKLKLQTYTLVEDAVSRAIDYGWRRAHKYVDEPDQDLILQEIERAVMSQLCEVVDFERS
jgi:hypothetical protein